MWVSGSGNINATGGTDGHDHTNPAGHAHSQSHSHSGNTWSRSGANAVETCGTNNANKGIPHTHSATNSSTNNTAYSSVVQTVCSTANTEPAYRTVAYLSAPEEPSSASGNMAMFGANF